MNETQNTYTSSPTSQEQKQSSDNTLSVLAHILGIFTGFIGSLIIYLMAQDDQSKSHARIALNWQISFIIYIIIGFILSIVLIGFFVIIAAYIANLVFCIIGASKASQGILWRYPASIPFLKA